MDARIRTVMVSMTIKAHQMMAWLSPAFPTGAFAYSHGVEYAVHSGQVRDAVALQDWLQTLLRHGAGWNDAVLLCAAHRGADVADVALALAGSAERRRETLYQGRAFARTVSAVLNTTIDPAPLPVVAGQAAAQVGIPLGDFLPLYLHSFVANLTSAAIRLIPLGQTEGQVVLHNLFPVMNSVADCALAADLDDLGTCSFVADITAMQHEDMTTRIFKT